ncbi:lysophosphatidic acid receptor 6-like [Pangasianodon hypophthalmus]|uniref:lysophosphatidic acid receptor 6-like n=1 Tax=Pangasianodon hypophthalmus TaxID=310915 RepID=UPI0023070E72|nr:lysophosphatidic acid receptor 6-like [Pangasianodon hypophthalmus]
MPEEMGSANEKSSSSSSSSSSFSNSTQAIDNNWCTDYPTAMVISSAISGSCFLLGFPVSLWVLHELLQRQRQRSTSDVFMLSLAVIDLIFTAHIPFSVCNFAIWQSKELHFILQIIYSLSFNGRPLFMACTCLDCYVAVVYPIVYKTSKKLAAIKKAIAITIFFTILGCGLIMLTLKRLITASFIAISLIMVLPVIAFCDISILRALTKPDPTGKSKIHPQKKQALHTISNSFIMTFVVYLPPAIIFSFGNLMPLRDIERFCFLTTYGICFSTVGCVIMPVLYLISVGKLDTFKNWWNR